MRDPRASPTTTPSTRRAGLAAQRRWDEVSGRAPHALLRRLLGLRLPRGRRGLRASRVCAVLGRSAAAAERDHAERLYEGWVAPPPARAGRARVPLSACSWLPRPRRAARAARPRAAVVGAAPRAGVVSARGLPRRPGAPLATRCSIRGGAHRRTPGRPGAAAHRACAPSGTCSTRSASTTASTRRASACEAVVGRGHEHAVGRAPHVRARHGDIGTAHASARTFTCRRSSGWTPSTGWRLTTPGEQPAGAHREPRAAARLDFDATLALRAPRASSAAAPVLRYPLHDDCASWRGSTRRRAAAEAEGRPVPPPSGAEVIAHGTSSSAAVLEPPLRRRAGERGRATALVRAVRSGRRRALGATSRVHDRLASGARWPAAAAAGSASSTPTARGTATTWSTLVRIVAREMPRLDRLRASVRAAAQRPRAATCAQHARRRARATSAAHYDLGNELFELFLDETMTYSCARVRVAAETRCARRSEREARPRLPQARPRARMTTCSRSAPAGARFALHAAGALRLPRDHHHDLARAARRWPSSACARPGSTTASRCCSRTTATCAARYDKLVSIEMIEAVGWQYFDTFFAPLRRAARAGRPDAAPGDHHRRPRVRGREGHAQLHQRVHLPRRLPALGAR